MAATQIELVSAFGMWGAATCLFAASALLAIWWHIGRKTNDRGQVYLAISVACWGISGLLETYYASSAYPSTGVDALLNVDQGLSSAQLFRLAAWRSILSLGNSFFILLALPWFRYIPARLGALINARWWPLIVGLPFVFALLPTIRQLLAGEASALVSELDVYYSLLTLGFLGAVLWSSFARRRLPALAYLTAISMVVTVGAQLLKLGADPSTQIVLSAIFKTCLIMLFFALALSWVRELAETAQPVLAKAVRLQFLANRQVEFVHFRENTSQLIQLTPALYDLLVRFAERRKKEPSAGWLEIKPKHESRRGKTYDIRDHNEVRRLLHAILDGLYGPGNWAKEQHELPLKQILFEMDEARPRTIRLALPESAISLENTGVSVR